MNAKERRIYNKHLKDCFEPDEHDKAQCQLIAQLLVEIESMQKEVNGEYLVKTTSDRGAVNMKPNPLLAHINSKQSRVTTIINALARRTDAKQQTYLKLAIMKAELEQLGAHE